ncbi:DUF2695 domain-containing protein [Amycolatopsis sp. TNS106]|uniref:DUF2695 domain-containing protein n=1 Tax=Amycolatopsis sp. TNS106 TaxID=2861750 RepID=UPI001C58148B|nr:DUF2695 domain-containing protein [Amycolatopsis sp. TNS106]
MFVNSGEKARRKALRNAYKEQQRVTAWNALGLDRAELDALYDWLDERLGAEGCDHSVRLTEMWASEQGVDWPMLREALGDAGGYCDCEVLANTDPDQTA